MCVDTLGTYSYFHRCGMLGCMVHVELLFIDGNFPFDYSNMETKRDQ